ncbi:uncharacterized protein STEHIDRAFT_156663 [Stereum hirsutum FP-91666 SS1]|uniref:uncharacterized protein n=1 Tax=Stereum hirsutum (strain FP-91666) TaxID=721885 RepID=UPI000440D6FA|nr:uncharacterized protein STEHIDRAFT_156663 [Stereum hirsutum FP-91666 SS1]EIM87716.1 hypothetical protein STEHIDRAFT_156663 [Stereum hirsutum FP-91666 SS1]
MTLTGKKQTRQPRKDPFITVSASQANREKGGLSSRSVASQLYIHELKPTPQQEKTISTLYEEGHGFDNMYRCVVDVEQVEAASLLASLGLDTARTRTLVNHSPTAGMLGGQMGIGGMIHIVDCGYNHTAAGTKIRQNPVPFTECPAHVELTYVVSTQRILRIRGLSKHNAACKAAKYSQIPRRPLHPSVFAVALKQLAEGVNLDNIHEKNTQMFKAGLYKGQPTNMDESKSAYRWLLKRHDTQSLYWQYNRLHGINVTEAAHVNIDEWMDKTSPRYNPKIADAIFHYSARAERGD